MSADRRSWLVAGLGASSLIAAITVGVLLSEPPPDRDVTLPTSLTAVEPSPPAEPSPSEQLSEPSADLGTDSEEVPAATGCGAPQTTGLRKLRLDGGVDYLMYVPEPYDPHRRAPIVIVYFVDFLRGPRAWLRNTGLAALADREGFLILMPFFDDLGTEETTRHTIAIVEQTRLDWCVDRGRLFAIGHGGGGRRARELRCELPLSGIATTGSGQKLDEVVCDGAPTPIIRLYGLQDERVPAKGGQGCYTGPYMSATQVEAIWAGRNKCEGRPKPWVKHRGSSCRIWDCAESLVSCALDGGHDWPGAKAPVQLPGCDDSPPDFPLVDTIWKFFEEHGRDVDPSVTAVSESEDPGQ